MPIALVADDSAEGCTRCDSGDEFDRSDHRLADPPGPSVTLPVGRASRPRRGQRHLRAVAIVMSHPDYGQVFPGVAVQRQTASELWVSGRPATAKDASLVAAAFDLSSLQGVRLDDDAHAREEP
jgi:hypothetical protein